MRRLTVHNPPAWDDEFDLLNLCTVEDAEAVLHFAGGTRRLTEYVAGITTGNGCKRSEDEVLNGKCVFCELDCPVRVLYMLGIQAAELHARLSMIEDELGDEYTLR